jgi:hypothetical protein
VRFKGHGHFPALRREIRCHNGFGSAPLERGDDGDADGTAADHQRRLAADDGGLVHRMQADGTIRSA